MAAACVQELAGVVGPEILGQRAAFDVLLLGVGGCGGDRDLSARPAALRRRGALNPRRSGDERQRVALARDPADRCDMKPSDLNCVNRDGGSDDGCTPTLGPYEALLGLSRKDSALRVVLLIARRAVPE